MIETWHATILDYDSDKSANTIPTDAKSNNSNSTLNTFTTAPPPTNQAYATELLAIKQEIAQLKTTIATAVEQIKAAIASIHDTRSPTVSNAMDTETEPTTPTNSTAPNTTHPQHDLSDIIIELRNEITKIRTEMQDVLQQFVPNSHPTSKLSPVTWILWTSVGLLSPL